MTEKMDPISKGNVITVMFFLHTQKNSLYTKHSYSFEITIYK